MSHKFIAATSTLAIALRLFRFFCALFDRTHKRGAEAQIIASAQRDGVEGKGWRDSATGRLKKGITT
jgi:hypothetical protein